MEIKSSSDVPGANPLTTGVSDLLTQLKAAGTIEAEVVKLLRDNQLLLTSRLGQILTSNKLHYRPGDRVSLRLDDSGQQPVLKVSPPVPRTLSLDSRQHPDLTRLLTPERPALARVVRVQSQQAEIQLGGQNFKLPLQVVPVKNQLLSLRRNDMVRSIEIVPIDTKSIYKAVLKQLIPRQQQDSVSSLVRLLALVSSPPVKPQRHLATGFESKPLPARAAAGSSTNISSSRLTGNASAASKNPGNTVTVTPKTDLTASNTQSQRPAPASDRLSANTKPDAATPKTSLPVTGSVADAARLKSPAIGARRNQTASESPRIPVRADSMLTGKSSRPQAPVVGARSSVVGKGAEIAVQQRPPAGASDGRVSATVAARDTNPSSPVHIDRGQVQPVSTSSPAIPQQGTQIPALQPLMQLVTRLPELDATQIKKWFVLAKLIRQTNTDSTVAAPLDVLRILKQFSDSENLGRGLLQAMPKGARSSAESDAQAARTALQEALPQQIREGLKLAEQSLSQNLLQRASLGLQQETQQPLNLSIALPFLDNHETKPVRIDLSERNQAPDEADRSWDIRLSFELGDLGSISCHLVLEGCTVAASFYSQHEQTRNRIEADLPQLRRQLSEAGFTPGEFHSFPGQPAKKPGTAFAGFSESLVDIEV